MHIFYNIGILIYKATVLIASLWNNKARLMAEGWKDAWSINKDISLKTAWFHVASLGEYEQARPVISQFKKSHPDYKVWLTFFSPSGYEVRKNDPIADFVSYLPMDTPRNARRFVALVNPSVAFFVKYDFWFNILRELKSKEIPTYIFSAIFRPNHYFFKPYGRWFLRQLGCYSHLFVQNEESLRLLESHGVRNCSIAGDTRFDRVHEIAKKSSADPVVENFLNGSRCLLAGSSWEPDEQNLKQYFDDCPEELKFIIAPHVIAPSHIEYILKLFGEHTCLRYSEIAAGKTYSNRQRVLIIDNIGHLSALYRYACVAYIGGGFGRGIHNILEALTYAKPVVFGPNHGKFKEACDIIRLGGGFGYQTYGEMKKYLDTLFLDKQQYANASAICQKYVEENLGSTSKILDKISV